MNSTAWPSRFANASLTPPPSHSGGPKRPPLLAFVAVTACFFVPTLAAAQSTGQNLKPGYAGSEVCSACHQDLFNAFQKNPHHFVETSSKRGWQGMACESCHGPGAKHAETADPANITNPAKIAPAKTDQTCLKCHLNEPTHVGRIQGGHARNQVACTACHSMHKGHAALRPVRATAINAMCTKCHVSSWAEFQRPFRHRLPEGAMSCVDCHNPHGTFLWRSIQTVSANEPGCFKCHSNIRGPFTYEHPPVKFEGCRTCHEPHGSANPRMLVRHEVRFVCLECHANIATAATIGSTPAGGTVQQQTLGGIPPAFHDLRSPRYRNCTICHQKIHGSNVDAALER